MILLTGKGAKMADDKLLIIVDAAADVVNVVDQILHKAGLMTLLGLVQPITAVQGLDFSVVKQQLQGLSADEKTQLETEFKNRVHLADPAIQKKLSDGVVVLDEVIAIVEQLVTVYNEAMAVVGQVKTLIS